MQTNPMLENRAENREVRFVFRELYINDIPIQIEKGPGMHDGQRLLIGKIEVSDRDIKYLASFDKQIHIGWDDVDQGAQVASMILDADSGPLATSVNFGLSRRVFAAELEAAAAKGIGAKCRDTDCQFCNAKILTIEDYPWAPQVYCSYCDSLNTTVEVPELDNSEKDYRICPVCQMYSRPRKFTIAYFYFLIVHAGVTHRTTHCCPGCMKPEAWKMIIGNLFGLLGMPLAVTQLIRVYRDSIQRGPFRGLDEANRLLKRGKVSKALDRYWKITDRHPVSAGVLYNVALGLLAQNDREHARQTLEMALENCRNYEPAIVRMRTLTDDE